MSVRESVVQALVLAASDGMERSPAIKDANANEVFSAYLSLLNATIQVLHGMGASGRELRAAIDILSLHCPVDGPVN